MKDTSSTEANGTGLLSATRSSFTNSASRCVPVERMSTVPVVAENDRDQVSADTTALAPDIGAMKLAQSDAGELGPFVGGGGPEGASRRQGSCGQRSGCATTCTARLCSSKT